MLLAGTKNSGQRRWGGGGTTPNATLLPPELFCIKMGSDESHRFDSASAVFKSCGLGHRLFDTLFLTVIESISLKWLSSLPILIQESLWWRQRSDR